MAEAIKTVGELAGACGHDGTDWQKVGISASDRLKVETEASDGTDLKDVLDKLTEILTELNAKLETGDLASGTTRYINTLLQQYTGSAWVKSNLLWGYNAEWDENLGGTATGTTYTNATAAVSSGYVYVLQAISVQDQTRATTNAQAYITRASGGSCVIMFAANLARNAALLVTGVFVMVPGDVLNIYLASTQAGDSIVSCVVGYKMKIDM